MFKRTDIKPFKNKVYVNSAGLLLVAILKYKE